MATAAIDAPPTFETFADVLDHLGGIPARRVRLVPAPGTATEADLVALRAKRDRPFELIDGILVEKGMSYLASVLTLALASILREFVVARNLGIIAGPDGAVGLYGGLIRIPDLSFASWARIPGGRMPKEPVPDLVPDLAIEVLSPSNTAREMTLKRRHYFEAGVRLVWIVDPKRRTVAVYTGPDRPARRDASATLDGGDVLPDFALPLANLFADLDRRAPG